MKTPNEDKITAIFADLSTLNWMRGFPADAAQLRFISSIVAEFVSIKVKKHEDLSPDGSDIVPIKWLINQIGKTCEWFPAPIQMRRIYEKYWSCLDGKSAAELANVIDE